MKSIQMIIFFYIFTFYKLFVHLFYTCSKIVAWWKKEHLIFYTFGYKNLVFFVKYVTFWALRQQYSMDIHKFLNKQVFKNFTLPYFQNMSPVGGQLNAPCCAKIGQEDASSQGRVAAGSYTSHIHTQREMRRWPSCLTYRRDDGARRDA